MRSRVLALVLASLVSGAALAQAPAQVKDINTTQTGGTWQWPWSTDFVEMGGAAWFTVTDGIHGTELWRSDGTEAGTVLVKDLVPGRPRHPDAVRPLPRGGLLSARAARGRGAEPGLLGPHSRPR